MKKWVEQYICVLKSFLELKATNLNSKLESITLTKSIPTEIVKTRQNQFYVSIITFSSPYQINSFKKRFWMNWFGKIDFS
jgi:predicted xylose isomerase-like sugar epimerase